MAAAMELEKEGISCEVIDPRTLVPLDIQTIVQSVKKTGRLITVEEPVYTSGWGLKWPRRSVLTRSGRLKHQLSA